MAKIKKPKIAANLARAIWRLRGSCENCGEANKKLDGAHLFGVGAHIRIASDLRNGVCLCFTCHRRFHDDSFAYNKFIEGSWAVKYLGALRRLDAPGQPKIDWDDRIDFLKEIKRAMEAGEMTIEQAREYEV